MAWDPSRINVCLRGKAKPDFNAVLDDDNGAAHLDHEILCLLLSTSKLEAGSDLSPLSTPGSHVIARAAVCLTWTLLIFATSAYDYSSVTSSTFTQRRLLLRHTRKYFPYYSNNYLRFSRSP